MADSEDYYDDEFALDEEQFPMQRAEAAAMLADEMRKEEEALSQVGPGIPYAPPAAPVSVPGPTMADLRGQYNLAVRDRDDMAALSAMREMEAARGGDPGRILRVQTQVPYEIPSPAQQQYEAQQAYMRELDMGVPQQTAFAKYAPVMLSGQTAASKALLPAKTPQPQLRDIAGVAYGWDPSTGTLQQLTEKKVTPSRWEEQDRAERDMNNKRIAKIREAIDVYHTRENLTPTDMEQMNRLLGEANRLERKNRELAAKYAMQGVGSTTPVVAPPAPGEERKIGNYVIRRIQR